MNLWIKVCGLTSEVAVEAAIEAGVDAVGFVFAPSRRQISAAQAAIIASRVPSGVSRVAVMLHPSQTQIDEVLSVFKPDLLQTDYHDLVALKLPKELRVLPVIRAGTALEVLPLRFLFEGPISGTGEISDWQHAGKLARSAEVVLAGGLNVTNVAAAIASVNPFGVDVSSGVECEPGVKDPEKIRAFVKAARAAAASHERYAAL